MATDKEAEALTIKDYIHGAVSESIQLVSRASTSKAVPKVKSTSEQRRVSPPVRKRSSGASSESEEPPEHLFDFQLIDPYIKLRRP